ETGGGALPPPRRGAPFDARRRSATTSKTIDTGTEEGNETMTTTTHETEITADDKVPVIRITREFDAPPAKVFRAHTDPELLPLWLGPRALDMTIDYFDCRTGGAYRYLHRRGEDEFGFHGSFHE